METRKKESATERSNGEGIDRERERVKRNIRKTDGEERGDGTNLRWRGRRAGLFSG